MFTTRSVILRAAKNLEVNVLQYIKDPSQAQDDTAGGLERHQIESGAAGDNVYIVALKSKTVLRTVNEFN